MGVMERVKAPVAKRASKTAPKISHADLPLASNLQGDCVEMMRSLPAASVDMIFADPPYFLSNGGISCHAGRMVKVDKGEWDKSQGAELNHEFNRAWIERCQKRLKPNGTLWVSGTQHVIYSIGYAMQQLRFKMLNDIAWEKPNPPPHLACRYFTHSFETLLWAAKTEKSKHLFNYKVMKAVTGKQMKAVWRDIAPDSEAEHSGEGRDVWRMAAPGRDEKTLGKHPTQKPVALLERIITASTNPGDLILDPFAGSATTGVAALRLGRRFVGMDADAGHIALAARRLRAAAPSGEGDLFTQVVDGGGYEKESLLVARRVCAEFPRNADAGCDPAFEFHWMEDGRGAPEDTPRTAGILRGAARPFEVAR